MNGTRRRGAEIKDRVKRDWYAYWKAAAAFVLYSALMNILFGQFCPMVLMTGFPCPGCGMTRALGLVAQMRFWEAYRMHPLIYGWIALGMAFCVRRYGMGKEVAVFRTLAGILLGMMVLLYVYRMIRFFPDQEPMTYFSGNLLQKMVGRAGSPAA